MRRGREKGKFPVYLRQDRERIRRRMASNRTRMGTRTRKTRQRVKEKKEEREAACGRT